MPRNPARDTCIFLGSSYDNVRGDLAYQRSRCTDWFGIEEILDHARNNIVFRAKNPVDLFGSPTSLMSVEFRNANFGKGD